MRLGKQLVLMMTLVGCAASCSVGPTGSTAANPLVGRVLGEATACDGGVDGSLDGGGLLCGSVFRRGFLQGAELSMVFDPAILNGSPGTLTTTGPNGGPEPCGATLTNEPLLPIASLPNDELSLYDFPGGGRVRNYIFAMKPTSGPMAGRDPMVFVSFLRGNRAEVRIILGSGAVDCAPTDCPAYASHLCDYFGVFPLQHAP